MYKYENRTDFIIFDSIENEDLLFYGIKKFAHDFEIITIKELESSEGGEWVFIFDDQLRKLTIEKKGSGYSFSGNIDVRLQESLKKVFK